MIIIFILILKYKYFEWNLVIQNDDNEDDQL